MPVLTGWCAVSTKPSFGRRCLLRSLSNFRPIPVVLYRPILRTMHEYAVAFPVQLRIVKTCYHLLDWIAAERYGLEKDRLP